MNVIQGSNAILSLLKGTYLPFVCASDVAIDIEADEVPTRTQGDGNWKRVDYDAISFSITLSGVMVFDDENFDSFEMLDNQFMFAQVDFRLSLTDDTTPTPNVKSFQGSAVIKKIAVTGSVGHVTKGDFTLDGVGKLSMFDGLIPCATVINTITVNGATSSSTGDITVDYTYTGDLAQVKYKMDGQGIYLYAQGAQELSFKGMSIGNHSIEIIPICSNGFEGVGLVQAFTITQNLSCTTVISDITIIGTSATAVVSTGAATQMSYSIDGAPAIVALITQGIPISSLAVGNHSITMTPLCSINGGLVPGTGFTKAFTVAAQPAQSIVNYNFTFSGAQGDCIFSLYINGSAVVTTTVNKSGSINVPVGAQLRAFCGSFIPGTTKQVELKVQDTTTNTVLFDQTGIGQTGFQYQGNANGDTYSITGTINDV